MKVRTQARREAIIEVAAKLFQEMGYERASMNELAKRLGGSKATLYSYFSSKEELFVAVVRAFTTVHLSDAVAELASQVEENVSLETTLMRFGERMLFVLTNDGSAMAVYRMVVAEAGRSNIGMLFYQSGPTECIDVLTMLMTEAMQRGELRPADARIRALQYLALITAEAEVRLYQCDPAPLDTGEIHQMVRRAVDLFLAGAAAHAGD
ncbi:TetR/AcrR family transcriptional regulator [Brenneria corticis]|uniref:TetR family transcriptional regulator n=1 Tax=Brenneria corticis TaxID=2173106 RepID=A0A2U1U325_9GAMM|nr:TetR/AcrR family transcriptional regulator [Brenneria sp. CFCC 11842]PWC16055.1 TetR family transcriptional regulator [Brenneria sp. CFCC 11842]